MIATAPLFGPLDLGDIQAGLLLALAIVGFSLLIVAIIRSTIPERKDHE